MWRQVSPDSDNKKLTSIVFSRMAFPPDQFIQSIALGTDLWSYMLNKSLTLGDSKIDVFQLFSPLDCPPQLKKKDTP